MNEKEIKARVESEERLNACIAEIATVLKKYGAHIGACVGDGSDTYGIYDEHMYISVPDGVHKHGYTIRKIADGWSVDSTDLEKANEN